MDANEQLRETSELLCSVLLLSLSQPQESMIKSSQKVNRIASPVCTRVQAGLFASESIWAIRLTMGRKNADVLAIVPKYAEKNWIRCLLKLLQDGI